MATPTELLAWANEAETWIADFSKLNQEELPKALATIQALRTLALIEALREEEGAQLILLCDNPEGGQEGQPYNAIECCASWTIPGWGEAERFTGRSLLDALQAAHKAMITRQANG